LQTAPIFQGITVIRQKKTRQKKRRDYRIKEKKRVRGDCQEIKRRRPNGNANDRLQGPPIKKKVLRKNERKEHRMRIKDRRGGVRVKKRSRSAGP